MFFVDVLGLSYFDIVTVHQLIIKELLLGFEFINDRDFFKNRKHVFSNLMQKEHPKIRDNITFVNKLNSIKERIDEKSVFIRIMYITAELCLMAYFWVKASIVSAPNPLATNYFALISIYVFVVATIMNLKQHFLVARTIISIINEGYLDQFVFFLYKNGFILRESNAIKIIKEYIKIQTGDENRYPCWIDINLYNKNKSIALFLIYFFTFLVTILIFTFLWLVIIYW